MNRSGLIASPQALSYENLKRMSELHELNQFLPFNQRIHRLATQILGMHGRNLNSCIDGVNGRTAAHIAALKGNSFLLRALVVAGADTQIRDCTDQSVEEIIRGNLMMKEVSQLIETKKENEIFRQLLNTDESRQFWESALNGHLEAVQKYHAKRTPFTKALVEIFNDEGLNLLQDLCYRGNLSLSMVRFLVEECGADPFALTENQIASPLSLIAMRKSDNGMEKAIFDYLRSRGGNQKIHNASFRNNDEGQLVFAKINGKF